MLKTFLPAVAFVLGAQFAEAATISSVEAKPGVAPIIGFGGTSVAPGGEFAFLGSGAFGGATLILDFIDSGANVTDFAGSDIFAPAPMDVASGPGFIEALYQSLASTGLLSDFDLFLVRIDVPGLLTDPLDVTQSLFYPQTNVLVTAVQPINVIPLPAGLPLILSSLGGFVLVARRRRAKRAAAA